MDEHEGARAKRLPVVMIIDDTPTNTQLLAQVLRHSYAVVTAASGPQALALLEKPEKPDLILLDVMMPGMDGYEVCRHLKDNGATRHIPVIFVTAMDQPKDQQLGFSLGAVDYITKPFEVPLVLARVNVHIRLKLKSEMLEKLAFLDGLTDIPNRRALEEALSVEWGRSKRSGAPLSVLMIDIDHFKAFNDSCGHGAGDECLRKVARELDSSLLRPGDFIGRYGGEEFAVILPDCDATGAALVAEKMREGVAALKIRHPTPEQGAYVTVSIGCTTRVVSMATPLSDLMDEADKALYLAKALGRNRVSAYQGS